jgi:hypothetical protein
MQLLKDNLHLAREMVFTGEAVALLCFRKLTSEAAMQMLAMEVERGDLLQSLHFFSLFSAKHLNI